MPDHDNRRSFRTPFKNKPTQTPRTPQQQPKQQPPPHIWTPDQVRALGMTTSLETAAAVIGIGRTLAYDLAKTGDFPVRILRLGSRTLIPVADLLTYLGEHPDTTIDP